MPTEKKEIKEANNKTSLIYKAGIVLVAMSALLLFFTYYPIAKEEIKYRLASRKKNVSVMIKEEARKDNIEANNIIYPADEDFGIVIPKIAANSKVIADVDWQNSREYQRALTKGVAHAEGTALPGENGNVFIFAHSGVDFYEAARYNAVFYLTDKLEKGDEIYIFYKKKKFVYKVTEKKIARPEEISYLEGDASRKTLTLMTCWPPGTTLKRMVVVAEQE